MNHMVQITLETYSYEKITTINGVLDYHDWLKREQNRFISAGREAEIRKKEDRMSLWANDVRD